VINRIYKLYLKSVLDWLIAFISLISLFPLFVLTSLLIKLDSKGPVFFIQERLGKNGRVFKLYKYRSMVVNPIKQSDIKLYENDPRITTAGRFIRKTSIDELPQLINILKGEMSFIGPRPPLVYFPKKYDEYSSFEKQRFLMKPGISGLAQVRCREEHNWEVNIPIDVEYINTFSLKNDFRLFFISLSFFFKTDNIYRRDTR